MGTGSETGDVSKEESAAGGYKTIQWGLDFIEAGVDALHSTLYIHILFLFIRIKKKIVYGSDSFPKKKKVKKKFNKQTILVRDKKKLLIRKHVP